MRFRLTDDQRALREGLREALARRFDGEALRAAVEGAAGTAGGTKLGGQPLESTDALGDVHAERKSADRAGDYADDRGGRRGVVVAVTKA